MSKKSGLERTNLGARRNRYSVLEDEEVRVYRGQVSTLLLSIDEIACVTRKRRANGTALTLMLAGLTISLSAQFGLPQWYSLGYALVGAAVTLWLVSRFDVLVEMKDEERRVCVGDDLDRTAAKALVAELNSRIS